MIPLDDATLLQFLAEDVGSGDITSDSISGLQGKICTFQYIAKSSYPFVLSGIDVISKILKLNSKSFTLELFFKDGDLISERSIIAKGSCETREFLLSERVSLNLIQHLSGIATKTFLFRQALLRANPECKIKILDTRKTLPLLRKLQKYAVLCGGGENHRFGLYDMILIKDNHIMAAGGVSHAVLEAKSAKTGLKIEVECANIAQVHEAAKLGVDVIMLDNMEVDSIAESAAIIRKLAPSTKIEISGGVTLANIGSFAFLDVDYISVGALTHSVEAIDISAKII